MSKPPSPPEDGGARLQSGVLRWLLVMGVLFGVVYLALMFIPVYHLGFERDETGGAIDYLEQNQGFQAEHLREHGRYPGDGEWAEWPTGPLPSDDGVAWGTPTVGAWARLPVRLRPKERLRFKFRLRASDRPDMAPKGPLAQAALRPLAGRSSARRARRRPGDLAD